MTLQKAMGQNGRVLTDLIPDLTRIIGEQPAAADLPSIDATNRFQALVLKMLQSLATRQHPLVIVMDGLQGMDQASVNLVRYLFQNRRSLQHVLIIGASRTGTLEPMFPEILVGDGSGEPPTVIELEPLDFFHVHKWLSAMLNSEPGLVLPLAELFFQKTGGNPFYLHQLLQAAYDERLLWFDFSAYRWVWDSAKIKGNHHYDNVYQLLVDRYERLPERTRRTLGVASCIGHRFSLRLLTDCMESAEEAIRADLLPAIEQRIVLPIEEDDRSHFVHADGFAFLHDQLQLEAYNALPDTEQKRNHLRVGQSLRRNQINSPAGDHLFEMVYHLNMGSEYLEEPEEKRDLAELNLHAGIRAKRTGAYESGLSLLKAGESLIRPDGWARHARLYYQLWLELAECEYICGNSNQAEVILELLKPKAESQQDRATLCKLEVYMHLFRLDIDRAVAIGLEGLAQFGLHVDRAPSRAALLLERFLTRQLAKRIVERDLQVVSDPAWRALDEIFYVMVPLTSLYHPDLFVMTISRYARLIVKRRRHGISPGGLSALAAFMLIGFGDYETAHRLSEKAWRLSLQQPLQDVYAGIQLTYASTYQFVEDIAGSKPLFVRAITAAIEKGDLSVTGLALVGLWNAICACGSLAELEQYLEQYQETVSRIVEPVQMKHYAIVKQFSLALRGKTHSCTVFDSGSFDEARFVRELEQTAGMRSELYAYYAYRIQLCYLFDDPQQVLQLMQEAAPYQQYAGHTIIELEQVCYRFLSLAAVYPNADDVVRRSYRTMMKQQLAQMTKWARMIPKPARHKLELMKAEWHRLFGNMEKANRHFELAIVFARDAGYMKWEGIANQLTALNCARQGRDPLAEYCYRRSLYCFAVWGASGKVTQLRRQYSHLLKGELAGAQHLSQPDDSASPHTPSRTVEISRDRIRKELDWELLRQAAVIGYDTGDSAEISRRLLDLAVRVAGAEEGCLLLLPHGRLTVAARSSPAASQSMEAYSQRAVAYVLRTLEPLVLEEARTSPFADEPYMRRKQPRSVLCLPICRGAQALGVLYLENQWMAGAFTPDRLDVLQLILSQLSSLNYPGLTDGRASAEERKSDAPQESDELVLYESLTAREKEILRYMVKGLSNKEIAEQLFLTEGTVKNYIFHIFGKLQVKRRIQAVNKAKALSLVD